MRLSKNGWLFAITILILAVSSTIKVQAQGVSADQYVAAGQQLLKSNNYTQAAQYFLAAAKVDPNNGAAYQGLGNCYYMGGRKSDALVYYQKALTLQPGNTQLAQFVQNLQAQLHSGAGAPGCMGMAVDPLTQGSSLFQQKQYSAAIPYFQRAAQQNPNDYRPFYYLGYAYYMTGNGRMAALYFGVANLKQPNASIQAYANQVNARLSPDDQQWVSTQLSQYSNSPTMASTKAASGDNGVQFGFNFSGDGNYIFNNPSQISNGAMQAGNVSIGGTTANILAGIGVEPYLQFGKGFELDFGATYVPIGGTLAYTWLDENQVANGFGQPLTTPSGENIYGYQDSFDTSMVLASVGFKILLPDNDLEGYLALGGDIGPVSTTFNKMPTDSNGNLLITGTADPSSGNYSSLAVGGYAKFGIDFFLSKTISLGPFLGFQVLTATNFKSSTNSTLLVNGNNGDVGTASSPAFAGVTGTPLTLDYSNINFGMDLKLGF